MAALHYLVLWHPHARKSLQDFRTSLTTIIGSVSVNIINFILQNSLNYCHRPLRLWRNSVGTEQFVVPQSSQHTSGSLSADKL
jgi:hypothetical protein